MSTIDFMETHVPFNRLTQSPKNVRRTGRDTPEYKAGIEALAASILTQGLLQNLIVHPVAEGVFGVAAGQRRHDAIHLLVKTGKIDPDWAVRVTVVDEDNATAISLAENIQRENMLPADEFDAFQLLTVEGWTIDRIADAFGVTPLVVERRLKLAKAAPELIERFRAGELSTDQMIALCATDDHAVQVEVWNGMGSRSYANAPADLRRAVLAKDVQADRDPRVAFIGGITAYKAAGGEVRRDLFTGDGQGAILTNPVLLDQLVATKLEDEAEKLRAEGWGWVEVWTEYDYTAMGRLGTVQPSALTLSDDIQAQLHSLETERSTLTDEQEAMHRTAENDDSEFTDEQWKRDSEIDERIEAINDAISKIEDDHASFAPEVMQAAGAVVIFNRGALQIERGRVRAADRKQLEQATGSSAAVSGGRETEPAGRKVDAVSDALRRSLLGHRNLAAQIEVAKRPDVAKVLMAVWAVQHILSRVGGGLRGTRAPTDLAITETCYGCGRVMPITDETGTAKAKAFAEECIALAKTLPDASEKQWDALAAMSGEELDKIIAYGVALSVSLTDDHKGLTGKLLDALNFDMSAHFEATADTYLGRVSKPLIVDALREAGKINGPTDKDALLAMKKGTLASEAQSRLAGSGWVPKGIRTPKAKAAPDAKKRATPKATTPKAAKATKAAPKSKSRKAKAESAAALAA
ncbi:MULTISPECIES: ParB/RepB/Spo0J family partition protein [Xanthomonas]|nr:MULTISPECIES: ParB/RepB/Spo0J family partition protein [Xanthomonas]MCM5538591.1 ParB/RepB/Spo0J family partition protein [Xanthomonas hortorum pv. pelargonii]MCM5551033.1 ParB/RepB/Spo0J family partition protein [Xanthomonas hortorum pv. pelargonii]MCM5580805.1 ParB/RepB/Spo0J family partition protein [Xanthomonas hortorum pv. pelargonii]MCM5585007.1 ParB/RepB/Spo0J family partition protein [Xanthomonas hortorum pv. pelargonii]MCM5593473.1 ParB/RepB/Spo0J family partition protein [Xanthomo